jgi:hypothetical protein
MMKKETEIQALETLKQIVKSKDSYLSDLFTPEMCDIMKQNIANDFPINSQIPLFTAEQYNGKEMEWMLAYDKLQKELDAQKQLVQTLENRFTEVLNDLVKKEDFELAYKHFDTFQVMKAKLLFNPVSLTDSEKKSFINSIS